MVRPPVRPSAGGLGGGRGRGWCHRLLRVVVAAAIGVGGFAAGARAAAPEPAAAWPWSAVVRVLRDGGGPCSGVLIAPRTVLTVGHCVATRAPWAPLPAARLSVRFADADADADYAVAEVTLARASPFRANGRLGPVRHDWALLALVDAPVEVAPVPYAGGAAARLAFILDGALFKVGWQGGARRRDVACRVRELDGEARAFSFGCPGGAGRGRSGSALIRRVGERYEVVAVQSAEARTRFTTLGIAVSPARAVLEP